MEQDERLSVALEECCQRVQQGELLEECLNDYPAEYREELADLVPLAGRVSQLQRDPSPEFQASLERQLVAAVDAERWSHRPSSRSRLAHFFATSPLVRVAAVLLVVLAIVVASGVGIVQAAENSLPDSPLYQVKSARQWIELTLARGENAKADAHQKQVNQRVADLEKAVEVGKPKAVGALVPRLNRSTKQMVDQAFQAQARGNTQPSRRALATIRYARRVVGRLESLASPEMQPFLQSIESNLDQQEQRLLKDGTSWVILKDNPDK